MQYFFILIATLLFNSSYAVNLFEPVENDFAMELLRTMFPGLTGGGGGDVLS